MLTTRMPCLILEMQMGIPATELQGALLRRTFVASTLCATKQLNKIPPSAEPFVDNALLNFWEVIHSLKLH
jgi:hypothetical protein